MEFRTIVDIKPSGVKIGYTTPVMMVGSCFSAYIGAKFISAKMPVMVNPFGTLYNPYSIANCVENILTNRVYKEDDLIFRDGLWKSMDHYTEYSDKDKDALLKRINADISNANKFLGKAGFLFVTFGTARAYFHLPTGRMAANCHKIPASEFTNELLTVDGIVSTWKGLLDRLAKWNPDLKVVFTVSPVRHWKDGAHGNQSSKSTLHMAIDMLLEHPQNPLYFPAYEIMNDELRDYRFYANDMLHPSESAVNYIWERFSDCFFDGKTTELQNDFERLNKSLSHRIQRGSDRERESFRSSSLALVDRLASKCPDIDLSVERDYFLKLQ